MIDIKRATELIRQHFAELTTEQFIENLKQSCPEVFEDQQDEDIQENTIIDLSSTEKEQKQGKPCVILSVTQ